MGNPAPENLVGESQTEESEATAAKDRLLWQLIFNQAKSTSLLLKVDELKALKERFDRGTAILPMVDPTDFRNNADVIDHNGKLLVATIKYIEVINQLRSEETERMKNASASQTGGLGTNDSAESGAG